jgi:anti-anti-sigma factor
MNLPTEVFGDVVVVHTPEEVGEDHSEKLESFLSTLDQSKVVVDLDGTETIDSVGLEMLLSVQDVLRTCSGDLKISTTNKINRKLLEITRLDQQLEVFDSVVDAVKSFA